jgi:hypothetical protein
MRLRIVLAVPAVALIACTSAGNGGASASPTLGSDAPSTAHTGPQLATTYSNWPTYHGNRLRTGYAPTMPAAHGTPRVVRTYHLDGSVYASPIVVGGRTIVATENDTVYAVQSGQVVWHRHLGTPAPQSQLPCGNIFPLGITGTPVYYNGLVYVAAEFGGPPRHVLYAIRFSTGAVVWHHSLDLSGVQTSAMQERGALLVADGRVWVPFGGLAGDCGGYKGRVVGVRLNGTGSAIAYTVPTVREAGIWTPPGPAFDGTNLFVAVGNGASVIGDPYDHSDSVLKINTSAHLVDSFSPTTWASDNAVDADLGSQGPAIVGKWVFQAGKSGHAYVLNRSHLGGIGGQVSSASLCVSFGGTAVVGSRVYVPCTDGVRAVRIDSTGHLHVLWHASSAITGSPVVGGGRVWSLDPNSGVLYALDPATGHVVSHVSVGSTSRFATPALFGSHAFVPTLAGLVVVATS